MTRAIEMGETVIEPEGVHDEDSEKPSSRKMRPFVALTVITMVLYLLPLTFVRPSDLLSLSIEDVRPDPKGLWVNFTINVRNRCAWPVAFENLDWQVSFYSPPVGTVVVKEWIAKFPSSFTVLPMMSVRLKGFATYSFESIFWVGYQMGYTGGDFRIRSLTVAVSGTVITLMFIKNTGSFSADAEVTYT